MGGDKQKDTFNELSGWLIGTSHKKYVDYLEEYAIKKWKAFVQIKLSTSNADEKVAKL